MSIIDDEKKFEVVQNEVMSDGVDSIIDDRLKVEFPASLAALTAEELAALDRATTRKVDILLMPTLLTLYTLNYLDVSYLA